MTDEQNTEQEDNIRRVSRKDRKPRLDKDRLVFPPETLPQEENTPASDADEADRAQAVDEAPSPPVEKTQPALNDDRYPPLKPPPVSSKSAPVRPRTRPRRVLWYNLGTLFFILTGCGVCGYYTAIALNPYMALNPFPPFTPVPLIITTTPLPPTATRIPSPTITLTTPPTLTFTPLAAEALPTRPTFTPAPFPFTIANTGVIYERNLTAEGCDWVSIAGSVRGLNGEILNGYGAQIVGEGVDETVYTGGADSLFFEPGEFELRLGDTPGVEPYTVTLVSPDGEVLSESYTVVTSDQCSQNVAVVNFVQNRAVE